MTTLFLCLIQALQQNVAGLICYFKVNFPIKMLNYSISIAIRIVWNLNYKAGTALYVSLTES